MRIRGMRSRIIVASILIAMGLIQLVNSTLLTAEQSLWLWLVGLIGAAAALSWGYARDRQPWTALAAYLCIALAILLFITIKLDLPGIDYVIAPMVLVAVPFVVLWLRNPQQPGWLLPGYGLLAIAGLLLVLKSQPTWLSVYVSVILGLPFVVLGKANQKPSYYAPGLILWAMGLLQYLVVNGVQQRVVDGIAGAALIAGGLYMLARIEERMRETNLKQKS